MFYLENEVELIDHAFFYANEYINHFYEDGSTANNLNLELLLGT